MFRFSQVWVIPTNPPKVTDLNDFGSFFRTVGINWRYSVAYIFSYEERPLKHVLILQDSAAE